MVMDDYIYLGKEALTLAVYVAGPILLLGLVSGLAVSIFQAATQINDAALSFLPKIVAMVIGLGIFGNFMLSKLADFTIKVYTQIGNINN